MRKILLFCILTFLFISPGFAAIIGVTTDVEGDVQLLRNDNYHELLQGVEIQGSDSIVTGKKSKLQIDMVDGTNLLVGPGTRLRLNEYTLNEDKSVLSSAVHLVSGWLRFAVTKLNDTSRFTIETPTMTMGIRGTEGIVEAQDGKGTLFLTEGKVHLYEVGAGTGDSKATPFAIVAGQHAEHQTGQGFSKQALNDKILNQRLPGRLKDRLQRREHLLKRRGIKPRFIRSARRNEVRKFRLGNPEARKSIRQRMRNVVSKQQAKPNKPVKKSFRDRMKEAFKKAKKEGSKQRPRNFPGGSANRGSGSGSINRSSGGSSGSVNRGSSSKGSGSADKGTENRLKKMERKRKQKVKSRSRPRNR